MRSVLSFDNCVVGGEGFSLATSRTPCSVSTSPRPGHVSEAQTSSITVTVNDAPFGRSVEPRLLLSDFLRHELGLAGTHVGCEHGVCGACTVLLDGEPVRSCLMLAVQAHGHQITTVEGLARDGRLHPIQQAFHETHALQCGFCTPGVLMTVTAFLRDQPDAGEPEIRECLAGNLCRCTGYQAMVDAVLLAIVRAPASSEPGSA